MTRAPDEEEPTRFLVSMVPSDLKAIDAAAKRLRMSRSRLVLVATMKYLKDALGEPCPICGRTEDHVH